jgi:hypothetical protein
MIYCIALHSDIETLKAIEPILASKGFNVACGDTFEDLMHDGNAFRMADELAVHLYSDFTYQFLNFKDGSNETITCTQSTLHETIDLIIKKLKEHEKSN